MKAYYKEMTLSEFIFVSLLRDIDLDFSEESYETQFDLGPKLYKKFLKSVLFCTFSARQCQD